MFQQSNIHHCKGNAPTLHQITKISRIGLFEHYINNVTHQAAASSTSVFLLSEFHPQFDWEKNIEFITRGDFKYTPVDTWISCSSQVTWKAIPYLKNSAWHAWKMRGGTFSLMNNSSKLTSYSHTSWSLKSGWPHFCWRQWKRARLLEGSPAFLLPSLLTTWEQVLWFLTVIKQMHTLTQSSFSAPSTFSPSSSPWLSCSPFLPFWHHVFWRILT